MSRPATKITPHTSDLILRESARLFAERGFHGTSIDDIGAACGTSGPAIYKHFSSKRAILVALLLDISQQLVDGGRHVVEEAGQADRGLMALITFHATFAANESDLIRFAQGPATERFVAHTACAAFTAPRMLSITRASLPSMPGTSSSSKR